jgi:hypothetical protein
MSRHHLRNGSSCLALETKVWVKRGGKIISVPIQEIKCAFDEKRAGKYNPNKLSYSYTRKDKKEEIDMVVNLAGTESMPLFIYEYDWEPGQAPERFYKITVMVDKTPILLKATEWHPIMKSQSKVTVAPLLHEGNDILIGIKVGNTVHAKTVKVAEVEIEQDPQVRGLALARPWDNTKFPSLDAYLENIEPRLAEGEAYWNDGGLTLQENIFFAESSGDSKEKTAGITSGSLALQYQLRNVIKYGIEATKIDEIEGIDAKVRKSKDAYPGETVAV